MKEFCRYMVVDEVSCIKIIGGQKYKDVSKLIAGPTFKTGFFRKRTIRTYYEQAYIGGRPAVVVFWTGGPKGVVGSCVYPIGCVWNLKGTYYTLNGVDERCVQEVRDYRERVYHLYKKRGRNYG